MICYKAGVAVENIYVASLYPFFKVGGNIVFTNKIDNKYYNRFGEGKKLISQAVQMLSRCAGTLWTPCTALSRMTQTTQYRVFDHHSTVYTLHCVPARARRVNEEAVWPTVILGPLKSCQVEK